MAAVAGGVAAVAEAIGAGVAAIESGAVINIILSGSPKALLLSRLPHSRWGLRRAERFPVSGSFTKR